jgi:hypothetical protein
MSVRVRRHLGLLACSMWLMGCAVSGADSSTNADPVITRVADPRIPYPLAKIEGKLSLREGCLMINGGVAFWPAGTTWDAESRQVRFSGDFQRAAPAPVDAHFTGGGGIWDDGDDLIDVLDKDAEAAIRDCMARTGSSYAVFVYP